MDSRAILKALKDGGWIVVRQKGSDVQLRHPTRPGLTTVPHSKRDVPVGTLVSIERQSGLKLR